MPPIKRRVLCAEPHDDICSLITTMLKREGHEVVSANTVSECLEVAAQEHFDLYIINDRYIDGDSIELCQKLRASDPSVPVLLFSLEGLGQHREAALKAGAQHYMTKTNDFVALVQTIDRLLQAS